MNKQTDDDSVDVGKGVSSTVTVDDDLIELCREKLAGGIRDQFLGLVKRSDKIWKSLTESEQRSLTNDTQSMALSMIIDTVRIIAADGRKVVLGTLEQVTVKDGFKAVVTMSRSSEHRHELVDATGKDVLIVVAESAPYMGADAADIDPDEPPLPMDDPDNSDNDDPPVFDKTDMAA